MKVILLAAGRGDRLRPHTDDRPKCLVELAGRRLIDWQLSVCRAAGIRDAVIVTGYRADMLSGFGTELRHNPDWAETNMVETLFAASDEFGDDIVVSYTDIVFEPRVLSALIASSGEISVIVDRRWREFWEWRFADPLSDAESLEVDPEGRITDIGRPAADIESIRGQYIGLMRFRAGGVERLREAKARLGKVSRDWMEKRPVRKAYMTDLLMEMVLAGDDVRAVEIDRGWLELDSADDLAKMRQAIADGSIRRFIDFNRLNGGMVQ